MKKRILLLSIYFVIFYAIHYLIYAIFIHASLSVKFGNNLSPVLLAQETAGFIIPTNILFMTLLISCFQIKKQNLRELFLKFALYLIALFMLLIFYLFPEMSFLALLEVMVFFLGFGSFIIFLNLAIDRMRIKAYWRQLVVSILVFAMLSSFLWLNPFFKSISTNPPVFNTSVNLSANLNPAIVVLENILNVSIYRSGNFYSQIGGEGLTIIADYYSLVKYWGGSIFFCLFYLFVGFMIYVTAFVIPFIKKFYLRAKSISTEPIVID